MEDMPNGNEQPSISPGEGGEKKETWKRGLWQVIKFGLVGLSNTAVDFGIFILLTRLFDVTEGIGIAVINVIAFSFAVTNSYLWNKYWTFKQKGKEQLGGEISKFLFVSVVGVVLNTIVVYVGTTLLDPSFDLSEANWSLVWKVVATGVVLSWNFIGYKFWAFKKSR